MLPVNKLRPAERLKPLNAVTSFIATKRPSRKYKPAGVPQGRGARHSPGALTEDGGAPRTGTPSRPEGLRCGGRSAREEEGAQSAGPGGQRIPRPGRNFYYGPCAFGGRGAEKASPRPTTESSERPEKTWCPPPRKPGTKGSFSLPTAVQLLDKCSSDLFGVRAPLRERARRRPPTNLATPRLPQWSIQI